MAKTRQRIKNAWARFCLVVRTKIWGEKVKKELEKRHDDNEQMFGHFDAVIQATDEMNRDAWAFANETRNEVDETTGSDGWRKRKK